MCSVRANTAGMKKSGVVLVQHLADQPWTMGPVCPVCYGCRVPLRELVLKCSYRESTVGHSTAQSCGEQVPVCRIDPLYSNCQPASPPYEVLFSARLSTANGGLSTGN